MTDLDQHTANRIYTSVIAAMQEAEEITGHMSVDAYCDLMQRISSYALESIVNARLWNSQVYKEFPDFDAFDDVNALLAIPGFEDCSWHNDVCPSVTNGKLRIFIDCRDPAARELGENIARFGVYGVDDDGEPTGLDCAELTTLEETVAYIANQTQTGEVK